MEESKVLYAMMMSAPNGMTVMMGRELVIRLANPKMAEIWGRALNEVIGKRLLDVFPELETQPFPSMLAGIFDTGQPLAIPEISVDISTPLGVKHCYVDFSYTPLLDDGGEVIGVIANVSDITALVESRIVLDESRRQEQVLYEELTATNEDLQSANEEMATINEELLSTNEQLAKAQQDLRDILDRLTESEATAKYMISEAPVAIGVLSGRDFIIETANSKMLEVWGKEKSAIGKPLMDALPELEGQPFLQLLDEVFVSGRTFNGDGAKVYLERKGILEEAFFNFVYHPLKGNNGKTLSIMVVANEVTEQMRAIKEVGHAQEMLSMATAAAGIGTWSLDLQTHEFLPSDRMKELFGFSAEEQPSFEMLLGTINVEYRKAVETAVSATIGRGKNYEVEFQMADGRDGKQRWLKASGKLSGTVSEGTGFFSGVVTDITERKEDDIRKNDFIAMVSHELKTPLTSLKAYVQLLRAKAAKNNDDFAVSSLDKALLQINKMHKMIKGFLDVTRLEEGKIHLDRQTFLFSDLLKTSIDEAELTMNSHRIKFHPYQDVTLYADRDKIGQVINNLLTNAIKYSPAGEAIDVRCRYVQDENEVEISVADNGIGIQSEELEKLFERFYRVANYDTRSIAGFGIGLYLCAEIIRRHKGKIWVKSEPTKGSIFYFTLPVEKKPEQA